MEKKSFSSRLLKSEVGQTTVEYILLLVVVAVFISTFVNSRAYDALFGADSEFFGLIKEQLAFHYRHGVDGLEDISDRAYRQENHQSFIIEGRPRTRFFISTTPYVD